MRIGRVWSTTISVFFAMVSVLAQAPPTAASGRPLKSLR